MKKTATFIIPAILVIVFGIGYILTETAQKSNTRTITIGAAIALTGDGALWGEMSLKGAQMAVDELNAQNGSNGKQIRLVIEDTQSTSIGSTSAVQKLVTVDQVSAVLGPTWLDVYQGAQGVVDGKDVAMISPDAGVEAFNSPKVFQNVFSSWYRSQPKAELLMNYLSSIEIKRLVIIHQNDSYYQDFGDRLEREATNKGITIVRREKVGEEADFRTLLTKIKQDRADMVFVALYDQTSVAAFFRNRAELYPELPIASDEFGQEYAGNPDYQPLTEGMRFFSAIRFDESFEQRFKAKYSGTIPSFGVSNSYDAIMMLADALKTSPHDLAGYLKKTEFTTTTFGTMRFDSINGVQTDNQMFVMKQFKNDEVKILK